MMSSGGLLRGIMNLNNKQTGVCFKELLHTVLPGYPCLDSLPLKFVGTIDCVSSILGL